MNTYQATLTLEKNGKKHNLTVFIKSTSLNLAAERICNDPRYAKSIEDQHAELRGIFLAEGVHIIS